MNIHEAFCFDSFQKRLLFWEDFLGKQIPDEWTSLGVGTVAVVDLQTGGIARLTSGGAIGNIVYFYWGDIRSLLVTQKVTIILHLKLDSVNDIDAHIGLVDDGNNHLGFRFDDSAHVNWNIQCTDGGATTIFDTGIAPDTDYHFFRVECHEADEHFAGNHVHFFYDEVEVPNSPITTNVPDDANDFLQPTIAIGTEVNAAKILDLDCVYIRQDR